MTHAIILGTITRLDALRLMWLYYPLPCPWCDNPDPALWHEVGLPDELFEVPLWYCGCVESGDYRGGYFTLEDIEEMKIAQN